MVCQYTQLIAGCYTLQIWFQNRRAKLRKIQKAQQLATRSLLQEHTPEPFTTIGPQPITPFVGGSPSPNSSVLLTPESITSPSPPQNLTTSSPHLLTSSLHHHLTGFHPLPISQSYPEKQPTVVFNHPNLDLAPYQWNKNQFVIATSSGTNATPSYSETEQSSTPMSSSMQTTHDHQAGTPLHYYSQYILQLLNGAFYSD